MPVSVTTTSRNDNPNTVWNKLAAKLGREPTNTEAAVEIRRIVSGEKAPLIVKAGDTVHFTHYGAHKTGTVARVANGIVYLDDGRWLHIESITLAA